MTVGFRFVSEEPLNCVDSVKVYQSEDNSELEHSCFSGVGITHIITSNEESIDKISELIRLKFDYSITTQKVFLIWTTNVIEATKATSCDDINSDCTRFVQLGQHLIKGVV